MTVTNFASITIWTFEANTHGQSVVVRYNLSLILGLNDSHVTYFSDCAEKKTPVSILILTDNAILR